MAKSQLAKKVAQSPYATIGTRRIELDISRIAAFKAEEKFVCALLEDGRSYLLNTTIKMLLAHHSTLLQTSRGALISPCKLEGFAPSKTRNRSFVAVRGGWIIPVSRAFLDDVYRLLRVPVPSERVVLHLAAPQIVIKNQNI